MYLKTRNNTLLQHYLKFHRQDRQMLWNCSDFDGNLSDKRCPKRKKFHRLAYWNVNHLLCGQELNISVREFREQASGLCIICHFSFRHSLQTLVTGLKILPLSMIFQSRVYGIAGLLSFKPQMYPDSFVLHKHTNENQYYLQNLNMQ